MANMKNGLLKNLSPQDRYNSKFSFYSYFITAVFMVIIGIVIPFLRDEYGLNYSESGLLISAQTFGVMLGCLCGQIFVALIGRVKANMLFRILLAAGITAIAFCGNYVFLIFCFLLAGFSRGCITNYHTDLTVHIRGGNKNVYYVQQIFVGTGMLVMPFISNFIVYNFGPYTWHAQVVALAAMFGIAAFLARRLNFTENKSSENKGVKSLGFFREPLFWIITILLFFYQGAEACTMNWMPTFFIDSNVIDSDFSVMLTALMWVALLTGRIIMLKTADKVPDGLSLAAICLIGAVSGFIMVSQHTAVGMIAGMMGVGFGISGVYGLCVFMLNDICSRYTLAITAFLAIANLGGSVFPFIIGVVSDAQGNRTAMYVIPAVITVMFIMAVINIFYRKRLEKAA